MLFLLWVGPLVLVQRDRSVQPTALGAEHQKKRSAFGVAPSAARPCRCEVGDRHVQEGPRDHYARVLREAPHDGRPDSWRGRGSAVLSRSNIKGTPNYGLRRVLFRHCVGKVG